ncbi:MAG: penicillin-binding protein, partial [Thermodesulfobacteriota bacterium]|nr:penicillin-binding protein [Thermodesulfobacteriota bacterium]
MPPVLVKKVVDRYGRVLEDNTNRSLDLERLVSEGRNIFPKGVSLQPEGRVAGLSVEDTEMPGKGFPTDVRGLSTIDKGPNLDIQSFLENSFPGRKLTRFSPERVMSPESAYMMASMLREVCVTGTASSVSRMKRSDLAGKTGTTDDCTDAWFIGFNPTYTTGVWIGHDTKVSLGRKEYGNVAALPVWTDFMKKALEKDVPRELPIPQHVVFRYDSRAFSGNPPVNALQAGPDFPDSHGIKPSVSIDFERLGFLPYGSHDYAPWSQEPFGRSFHNAYGAHPMPSTGQALRLLSSSGEDLGYGVLARDERGRTTIMPVYATREDWSAWGPSPAGTWARPETNHRRTPYWEGQLPHFNQNSHHGIVR